MRHRKTILVSATAFGYYVFSCILAKIECVRRLFPFPNQKQDAKTSLVLKGPKTAQQRPEHFPARNGIPRPAEMEQDFFQSSRQGTPGEGGASDEIAQAMRLMQDHPDMAKLVIAALGGQSGSKK